MTNYVHVSGGHGEGVLAKLKQCICSYLNGATMLVPGIVLVLAMWIHFAAAHVIVRPPRLGDKHHYYASDERACAVLIRMISHTLRTTRFQDTWPRLAANLQASHRTVARMADEDPFVTAE